MKIGGEVRLREPKKNIKKLRKFYECKKRGISRNYGNFSLLIFRLLRLIWILISRNYGNFGQKNIKKLRKSTEYQETTEKRAKNIKKLRKEYQETTEEKKG